MKIVLCDNGLPGLVRFRLDLIEYLVKTRHEVMLIFPSCTDSMEWRNQIPSEVKFIPIDFNPSTMNPLKDLAYFMKLLWIYRSETPDLCIHYTIKPNIYGTLAATTAKIKNIAMVAGLGYIFEDNHINKRIGRVLYKLGLRSANHVITLNNTIKEKLINNGFVVSKNITLFNCGEGVNLNRYPLFEQKYTSSIKFLTVARVLYDKGYAEYVEAAEIVHAIYPDVVFEWLGDYDHLSPMRVPHNVLERDVSEGKITYLGTTDDVLKYLRRDGVCICLPSYHEGLSKSLMEACSVGLPIIASNIPGCQEAVDNGINGFLVQKGDSRALARAMIKFIELSNVEKIKMAQASYLKAVNQFDVKHVLDGYHRIITENLCLKL